MNNRRRHGRRLRSDYLAHVPIRVVAGQDKGERVVWSPRSPYGADQTPWVILSAFTQGRRVPERRYRSSEVISDADVGRFVPKAT
jgi:hypothetical protein